MKLVERVSIHIVNLAFFATLYIEIESISIPVSWHIVIMPLHALI